MNTSDRISSQPPTPIDAATLLKLLAAHEKRGIPVLRSSAVSLAGESVVCDLYQRGLIHYQPDIFGTIVRLSGYNPS